MAKPAYDVFGEALYARAHGDRTPFYFVFSHGLKERFSLKRYFRDPEKLAPLERKLIGLARGRILDVGCATGNYVPLLAERAGETGGSVTAIEISPAAVKAAHERGVKQCAVADIFSYAPRKRFDTITLLESNIGLGGTVPRTKRLLRKLASLLAPGGQVLLLSYRMLDCDFHESRLRPMWKGELGEEFGWIHFSDGCLADICEDCGFTWEIVASTKSYSLFRLKRKE